VNSEAKSEDTFEKWGPLLLDLMVLPPL